MLNNWDTFLVLLNKLADGSRDPYDHAEWHLILTIDLKTFLNYYLKH